MSDCVALLGGTFDPVHCGHVALGAHFAALLGATELRVIPAGRPWQKATQQASPRQRADMAQLAFAGLAPPARVDRREIERAGPSYTIDTLRALRAELGPRVSLALLIGADQLRRLDSWKEWRHLFDYAHLCVAARPGFALDGPETPPAVAAQIARRLGQPDQIRSTPQGLTYLENDFAVDISATHIRAALRRGEPARALVPATVLDYIEQHHLYKN